MANVVQATLLRLSVLVLCLFLALLSMVAQERHRPLRVHHNAADSVAVLRPDSISLLRPDSVEVSLGALQVEAVLQADSIEAAANEPSPYDQWEERDVVFNPDPNRAVWMAALFPGLGQLYNRRYWKLPIIIGGYMGLAYATTWNNTMLSDYTKAYRDIMDNDPDTNSYMNLFPPTTQESSIDKTWLTNVLQSRKNYFRRNRDICIIAIVGVYLLAIVDAYVDASMSHFDITPDLTMDLHPDLFLQERGMKPSVGLTWALNF